MMKRYLSSLVLCLMTVLLGACAGTMKKMPDGTYGALVTVGDTLDRSTSVYGQYDCPEDKDGKPLYGKCKELAKKEAVHGQTVAGQALIGAVSGVGAAATNGVFARSVAGIGRCSPGSVCNGTVITNQVQSVADALNQNKVDVGASAGISACAATNTCGK